MYNKPYDSAKYINERILRIRTEPCFIDFLQNHNEIGIAITRIDIIPINTIGAIIAAIKLCTRGS
ncbi:unnamed protein product [Mucor hiemalis]